MTAVQVLSLLLAAACAVIVAFAAGIAAHCSGMRPAQALLVASGAAASAFSIYLAAVTAYK